ncbi:MAG: low molecular weight phosphotyrosine protein phosphatase [Candidatus Lindowbacteria bacterium]|nr:low molecular weight phosphotyrosine protein phosphatase [Candidatus Lindowbacteria bacterium]
MKDKPKVLFVCLGNICRSPMAHGIAEANYADRFSIIDSAGTSGYHIGEPPDRGMQKTARGHGFDISNQQSRQVEDADFYEFDYIFAMDGSNLESLQSKHFKLGNATALVERYLDEGDVPDPYYGGQDGFERCYKIIEDGMTALLERLDKK